jgi:hypothetical protein
LGSSSIGVTPSDDGLGGERAVRNDVPPLAVPALTGERRALAIEMNRA